MSSASHLFLNKMDRERFDDRVSVDQNCMVLHQALDRKNAKKVDADMTSRSSSSK